MNVFPKIRLTKRYGILFIVWGWLLVFTTLAGYVKRRMVYSFLAEDILNLLKIILPVIVVTFTGYYLFEKRKDKGGKPTRIALYSLWISMVGCMILVNLIQYRVMHQINFELQHPLFMVLMAFTIVMTGVILRYPFVLVGGVIFGVLALTASSLELPEQLLIESLAWFVAFVIPGHLLNAKKISTKWTFTNWKQSFVSLVEQR